MSSFKIASTIVTLGTIAGFTACKGGGSGDINSKAVDTSIVTTKVRDTTIVKADTSIHVDTVKQTHNVPGSKP